MSIIPPGEAVGKLETAREELLRRFAVSSARLLPVMLSIAGSPTYPEPPKEARYRIRVHGEFTLDPSPVLAGGAIFLPLADDTPWREVRRDPVAAPLTRGEKNGGVQSPLPHPFPGVFLGSSPELSFVPSSEPFPDSLSMTSGSLGWRKCSLACLRVVLGEWRHGGTADAYWEFCWEVPVVSRG